MSDKNDKSSDDNDNDNIWLFSPENDAHKYAETNAQLQNRLSIQPHSQASKTNKTTNILVDEYSDHLTGGNLTTDFKLNNPSRLSAIKMRIELARANSIDWLTTQLIYERDQGNYFNIAPVFIGFGIWTYFTVAFEPSLLIVISTLIAVLILIFKTTTRGFLYYFSVMIALVLGGMTAAQTQVNRAQMQVPSTQITSNIRGIVLSIDKNTRGSPRYLIRPTYIEKLMGHKLPRRVRISTSKKYKKFQPGDTISGLARISPLPGPAYPGGYDFAFFAWFKGHAMSGFFMGAPTPTKIALKTSMLENINIIISNWRVSVGTRIRAGIEGEPAELAVALITGDRSGLSARTQESLRKSGLAHILAISGLHMALVTLTMVWLVRSVLLFIPNLANKYPIKKWAIGVGFIVATLYLFLSGSAIATQRAWIMISIMMLANLMDRPAITIRSVAVAAFVILILFPASLFSPGFQMSFAAVVALVSIYKTWTKHQQHKVKLRKDRGLILNSIGTTIRYGIGLSFTSLIAGTATAFFAAWHFHRIAPLGFIANLGAMPIVSALVMPLALISVLLMPYGLEGLTLMPLGLAIEAVVWVSDKTNSIPIDFSTGIQSRQMLYASLAMLGTALLPIGKLRYVSIIPTIVLIYTMTQAQSVPHLLIAQDGRTIAVATNLLKENYSRELIINASLDSKIGKGALTLLYPKRNKFISQIWLKAYSGGLASPIDWEVDKSAYSKAGVEINKGNSKNINLKKNHCDKEQCNFMLGNTSVYIIYNPKLISKACEKADILAAPRLWYVRCKTRSPKVILKRQDFERNGSHAIWLTLSKDREREKDILKIKIKTAWHPVKIEPTPNHYVDANSTQLSDLISEKNSARRPWLRRYEISRNYKSKKTKKSKSTDNITDKPK